ncbi:MAG: oligosaccharide flippase family protein, partial [bacterium]
MEKSIPSAEEERKLETPSSFTKSVFYQTATNISLLFFNMVVSVITARWLGPYGKGVINTLGQFLTFLGLLLSPGLYASLMYHIAGRKFSLREGIATYTFFTLVYSLPLTFFVFIISPFLTHNILKGVPLQILFVSLIFSFIGLYFNPLSITLYALQRFPQIFYTNIICSLANLLFLALFLIFLKMGILGAMLSQWFLVPLTILVNLYFLKDVLRFSFFKPIPKIGIMKNLLSYGWKVFLGNIFWQINLRADVLIVNYFKSPSSVGLYTVGVSYTELLRLLPGAIGGVLFPRVSSLGEEEALHLTCLVTRLLTLYILIFVPLLLFLAHFVIPFFFGTKFISSISVVPYLMPGVVAWSYLSQISNYLSGRGHPEYHLYSTVLAAFVTLAGDFLLIPR